MENGVQHWVSIGNASVLKAATLLVLFTILYMARRDLVAQERIPSQHLGEPQQASPPPPPRDVGKGEITVQRNKLEDELRIAVLAAFDDKDDKEQTTKLQKLLNAPWDKEAVEYLWNLAWGDRVKTGLPGLPYWQTSPILNLLVYLRVRHDGCEIGEMLSAKFDSAYKYFLANPLSLEVTQFTPSFWKAIESYGSPRLLTPAFWELFDKHANAAMLRVLLKNGDEDSLRKLQHFKSTCAWSGTRMELLKQAISAIESRLNAAKKQNETSKP